MRDYWLSKLFFDLQEPDRAAEYRAGRAQVPVRYDLDPQVRAAVEADDVAFLSRPVIPLRCAVSWSNGCRRSATVPPRSVTGLPRTALRAGGASS